MRAILFSALIVSVISVNAKAESGSFAIQSAAAANSTQALRSRIPAAQASRVDQAVNTCRQRPYRCEFTTKSYPDLQNVDQKLSNTIRPFLAFGGAVDSIRLGGASMQSYLRRRFEVEAAAKKYSECQQVCYSGCLTAELIKYDDTLFEKMKKGQRSNPIFDSVEGKLRAGKGVCTDFSRAANSLLGQIEAAHKVLIVNSGTHAVVQVDFNNRSYIYEPQASVCKFFQLSK